jgi:hypothetical protein
VVDIVLAAVLRRATNLTAILVAGADAVADARPIGANRRALDSS